MGKELKLVIKYHPNQSKVFFESDARYKIIAKGRRFGLTRGFANYVMEQMIEGVTPVLWVDTIYGNIERYVERYFMPVLRTIPKEYYTDPVRNRALAACDALLARVAAR